MLKKSTILLLILIYSFSTFGAGLNTFYCCGKLKSISFSFGIEQTKSIEKSKSGDNCCKINHYTFKGKEKHFSLINHYTANKDFKIIDLFTTNYNFTASYHKDLGSINGINAPPLYKNLPLYISNRVFRI